MMVRLRSLAAALFLLVANQQLLADCARPPFEVEYERSAAVFSGTVIAMEYRPADSDACGDCRDAKVLVARVKVERWWKGGTEGYVPMYTDSIALPDGGGIDSGDDFHFETGRAYLIFAFERKGHLGTSECRRTKELSSATEELRRLGTGTPPKDATRERSTSNQPANEINSPAPRGSSRR